MECLFFEHDLADLFDSLFGDAGKTKIYHEKLAYAVVGICLIEELDKRIAVSVVPAANAVRRKRSYVVVEDYLVITHAEYGIEICAYGTRSVGTCVAMVVYGVVCLVGEKLKNLTKRTSAYVIEGCAVSVKGDKLKTYVLSEGAFRELSHGFGAKIDIALMPSVSRKTFLPSV